MRLELESLSKSFGDQTVLEDLTLDLADVRSLALIGPSGGGKSTLLRLVAGLDRPDSGTLRLNGEPVPFDDEPALLRYRRTIGTVFQAFNLFPHLTALENIVLPLEKAHGHSRADARCIALAELDRFRLAAHAHKKPGQLSGGQRQRVALVRALAIKPRLLLFDEPTSALDPEMTAEVLDAIRALSEEGRDFLLITHEMSFARAVADHVAFLAIGKILETGPAEAVFEHPQTPACRAFLERILHF